MSQLKEYSLLTKEVTNLGPPTENLDQILGLAEMEATNREDSVIVFVQGPVLQKWVD